MRFQGVLFSAISLLLGQQIFASAEWPNEPTGAQTLIDCPFSGNVCNLTNIYNTGSYVNDASAPLSGPGILDDYVAAGSSTGSGKWVYETIPHAKEVFIGAWWKTNAEFQGIGNNINKMLFQWGDGHNDYWGWNGPQDGPRRIIFCMENRRNNCHLNGVFGCDNLPEGTVQAANLAPNVNTTWITAGDKWHRLEMYTKTSTTTTSRDGIVRWWVDGVLQGNYTNVNYHQGFTAFQITHTWDGSILMNAPSRDMSRAWHHYWDHIRVSIPNCGSNCPANVPLMITSPIPTSAQVGKTYSTTFRAENGKAPYGWTISAGSLPPGFALNKTTGVLSGTPTTVGRSDFTIKVMDSSVPPAEATKAFTIIVSRSTGMGKEELTVDGSRLTAEPKNKSVIFHLGRKGLHTLNVYDLSGREMWRHSGSGEAVWNHGGRVTRGIYLMRMEQNGKSVNAGYVPVW